MNKNILNRICKVLKKIVLHNENMPNYFKHLTPTSTHTHKFWKAIIGLNSFSWLYEAVFHMDWDLHSNEVDVNNAVKTFF